MVAVKTNVTRTVQIKCNNDLSSFQLSISYFVMNIIAVLVQQSGLEYVRLPVISLACALHIHIVIMKC